MNYYVLIVQNRSTQAVFSYSSFNEALSKFHSELAYRAESRTSTLCMIVDDEGNVYNKEYWKA